jgi:hypothetical protein
MIKLITVALILAVLPSMYYQQDCPNGVIQGGKCVFGLDDGGFWAFLRVNPNTNKLVLQWTKDSSKPWLKWVWNGDATRVTKLESVDNPGNCLTRGNSLAVVPCDLAGEWIFNKATGQLSRGGKVFLVKNKN